MKNDTPLTAAQKKLADDNYALVFWGIKKLGLRFPRLDGDSLMSACQLGLIMAARTYNPSKASFSTHAFRAMWSCCQRETILDQPIHVPSRLALTKRNDGQRRQADMILSLSRLENDMVDFENCGIHGLASADASIGADLEAREEADRILSRLTPIERSRVQAVIMEGYTQTECAAAQGCSENAISISLINAMKRLDGQMPPKRVPMSAEERRARDRERKHKAVLARRAS